MLIPRQKLSAIGKLESQGRLWMYILMVFGICALRPEVFANPPNGWTTGGKSLLIITVDFTDYTQPATPPGGWTNVMAEVNDFFLRQSYSNYWISSVAVVPVSMGVSSTNYRPYSDWKTTAFLPAVRAKALVAGYDSANFDLEIVHTRIVNESPVGTALHGGKSCWLNCTNGYGRFVSATAHELGHNLGLFHTRGFSSPSYVYPSKTHTLFGNEYGGMFDVMGICPTNLLADFCAYNKNFLGWLPDDRVAMPATSGTFRIHAFDQDSSIAADKTYALKLLHDPANSYWFEFRQAFTNNPWSMSGLIVYSGGEDVFTSGGSPVQLDMTPGSRGYIDPDTSRTAAAAMMDGPLALGRTFSDINVDFHVTPVRKGGTVPESIDVVVQRGPFPGNLPPIASLIATNLAPATNQIIHFSADASDPDGDDIAFYWEFDDTSAPLGSGIVPFGSGGPHPNATINTSASHIWMSNGMYQVRCTVTDMKGGKTTASAMVTVGSGGGVSISGSVNDESGNPLAGAVVTSIASTNVVASAETASNGQFRIVARSNTNYKLLARWQGRTFTCNTPGGSATGTVNLAASSVTNINFTRVTNMWTIGGGAYLNGIGRTYNPDIDGALTIHDGNPAHDTVVDTNGNWRMTVPEGPLALTFSAPSGYTVRCTFQNPYQVMDNYTLLTLIVDIPGKVSSQGFGVSRGGGNDFDGNVHVPVVLYPPPGYTNSIWPPNAWLGGMVDARSTAAYGIDYRLLGMEINFTNNTSVFTNYIILDVLPGTSTTSRLVMLNLAAFNFGANLGAISNFTYAIIPPGADADGDGMPDGWEWKYSPGLTNITSSDDNDDDGFTGLAEYIADTDPANDASYFPNAATTNTMMDSLSAVIKDTSTGRVYGIYANTNLQEIPQSWVLVPPEQTGTASALTLTITNTISSASFRTGVRLP